MRGMLNRTILARSCSVQPENLATKLSSVLAKSSYELVTISVRPVEPVTQVSIRPSTLLSLLVAHSSGILQLLCRKLPPTSIPIAARQEHRWLPLLVEKRRHPPNPALGQV